MLASGGSVWGSQSTSERLSGRSFPDCSKSHFSGCGRLGLPAAEAKAGVWPPLCNEGPGLRALGPPSLTRPHPGFSCSLPPTPPTFPSSAIPTGPASLHGHGLGLQLPDVPPSTGHSPRPAHPAWSVCTLPWRTWVSGAGSPCPQPFTIPWTRFPILEPPCTPLLHLPIPASCRLASVSAGASFLIPRPPSCLSLPAFPRLAAPSLLASPHSSFTDCGQMGREVRWPWAPGLWNRRS